MVLTVVTSSFASVAFGAEGSVVSAAKINEINQQIQQKGAHWQAKETWVSKLSPTELKRMLGSNDMPKSTLDYTSSKKPTSPSKIDWRNQDGINWLGSVMNQGNCGSCVAFSTVGTLETQVSISAGLPWLHPTFSPDQIFACGGGGCDSGWTPGSAASFLKGKGIVDSACAPDTMGSTGQDVSCGDVTTGCGDVASRTYKISSVSTPSGGIFGGGNVEAVKEALTHGPLVTTLTVYTDFLTYTGGVYKNVTGKAEGGHAVSLIGYDNEARAWIIRNSWGDSWGDHGFAMVSWDDVSGVGSNTWQFKLPSKAEYLTITSPAESDYLSGQYQTKVGTSSTGNVNVEVRKPGDTRAITSLSCIQSGTAACVSALDTTALEDGRYEMIAKTGASNAFSQVRSFYVVNHAPTNLTINYTGADVDLTQPVTGRIEFNIQTTTSSVPFHSITMLVRQNGKILAQRTTTVILPSMKLGFRTNTLPDGDYELLFRGEMTAAGKTITVDSNVNTLTFHNPSDDSRISTR